MTWAAGTRVGPYELESPVGDGGMGEVWKAVDTRLRRPVAIKRLKNPIGGAIAREARVIAALNHPHICTLYDVADDYLVMEFLDGAPPAGPLPPADVLRLARQIGDALAAAHARGILHRDLKPSNILVCGQAAKLLDFGVARALPGDPDATSTREVHISGTVAYMSPEQARGDHVDPRSDIFSFGAVLYELASGTRAFPGRSTAEILTAVLRDDPPALEGENGLGRVIARCLRKDPGERFQSMTDLLAALAGAPVEPAAAGTRPSVAVLPFADMSPGRDQEYFSDGLAEEIINVLAQIPSLRVIARTSSFAFKGKHTDLRDVARALGVSHIVEGSVRKAGDRIRVTAQLIMAGDASHLWSDRYDRDLADVFAVQDEIAAAIARALTVALGPRAAVLPVRGYVPAMPAYEAFLKARHYQFRMTPESIALTRQYLDAAITLDPSFPMAHIRLGGHFMNLALLGLAPAAEMVPRAHAAARRALELDPGLAEAHAFLGTVALASFDWETGARHFAAATAKEPMTPYVRGVDGFFNLYFSGRAPEAVERIRPALAEDPLSMILHHKLGTALLACWRLEEAREALREAIRLEPGFVIAGAVLAVSYWIEGRLEEALAAAESAYAVLPSEPVSIGLLAALLRHAGQTSRSAELYAALETSRYGTAIGRALYAMVLGDVERAADAAHQALAEQHPAVLLYLRLPVAADLRASPRWAALAHAMNLPDASR